MPSNSTVPGCGGQEGLTILFRYEKATGRGTLVVRDDDRHWIDEVMRGVTKELFGEERLGKLLEPETTEGPSPAESPWSDADVQAEAIDPSFLQKTLELNDIDLPRGQTMNRVYIGAILGSQAALKWLYVLFNLPTLPRNLVYLFITGCNRNIADSLASLEDINGNTILFAVNDGRYHELSTSRYPNSVFIVTEYANEINRLREAAEAGE